MEKIKWNPAPPNVGWNRVKTLRKMMGINQATVAVGAGVSIATLYNIEHGYEQTTTQETKKKLATFFKCDVEDIFPAQMFGNITKEEYYRMKMRQTRSRRNFSHRFLTLKDFIPDLQFKDDSRVDAILEAMTIDELGYLFHSGLTKEEALGQIRRAARKYNLPMSETK